MKHLSAQKKQQQIEWRRAKVLELSSRGYNEWEIAERLQPLAVCTVHRDLVYLRKQAQENLQHHIHEVVPAEYQKCMVGIPQVLKKVWGIADRLLMIKLSYRLYHSLMIATKYKIELATNGVIITDAMK
jgi:hypothetical protein